MRLEALGELGRVDGPREAVFDLAPQARAVDGLERRQPRREPAKVGRAGGSALPLIIMRSKGADDHKKGTDSRIKVRIITSKVRIVA